MPCDIFVIGDAALSHRVKRILLTHTSCAKDLAATEHEEWR